MSDFFSDWEMSIKEVMDASDRNAATTEYERCLNLVLSAFNVLMDLIDNVAPLVFAEGLANKWEMSLGDNITEEQQELASLVQNFSRNPGPFPENYDILAVQLFRIVYSISISSGEAFDNILKSELILMIESYRRTYTPAEDKPNANNDETVKED